MKKCFCFLLVITLVLSVSTAYAKTLREQLEEWDDEKIEKLIVLAQEILDSRKASKVNDEYVSFSDFDIKYTGYRVVEENGKNYLVIDFNWKNTSDESSAFWSLIKLEAYQDGIELETGYVFSIETNTNVKIKPNAEYNGSNIFELRNKESKVEIVISPLFDFFDEEEDYTFIINIK